MGTCEADEYVPWLHRRCLQVPAGALRDAPCHVCLGGSAHKVLISSPVHEEEKAFLIIFQFFSYLWVGVLHDIGF